MKKESLRAGSGVCLRKNMMKTADEKIDNCISCIGICNCKNYIPTNPLILKLRENIKKFELIWGIQFEQKQENGIYIIPNDVVFRNNLILSTIRMWKREIKELTEKLVDNSEVPLNEAERNSYQLLKGHNSAINFHITLLSEAISEAKKLL